jgi:hypothetical protein
MVQRIVKFIGHAYSSGDDVQVQCIYNGAEVFNSTVEKTVQIPVPLTPITMEIVEENHRQYVENQLIQPEPNGGWGGKALFTFETTTDTTGQIPVTISVTGGTLFFSQFWMNYTGYTPSKQPTDPNGPIDLNNPNTYFRIVPTLPDSYFSPPHINTLESDGISNLTKNGQPWVWRVVTDGLVGDWVYPIYNGETVTFDFFVDPDLVKLSIPTP